MPFKFNKFKRKKNLGAVEVYIPEKTVWEAEDTCERLSSCGRIEAGRVLFAIPVLLKIKALFDKYTEAGLEFTVYLIGQKEGNDYIVEDIYIPRQEVTSADATITDDHFPPGVIGILHSHHTMGAFFSGTDEEYVNNNYYSVSVVIAKSKQDLKQQLGFFDYKAIAWYDTPCGGKVRKEVEVGILTPAELQPSKEELQKIQKQQVVLYPHQHYTRYHATYCHPDYEDDDVAEVIARVRAGNGIVDDDDDLDYYGC